MYKHTEKNITHRIAALLLCAIMLLTALPASVFAAGFSEDDSGALFPMIDGATPTTSEKPENSTTRSVLPSQANTRKTVDTAIRYDVGIRDFTLSDAQTKILNRIMNKLKSYPNGGNMSVEIKLRLGLTNEQVYNTVARVYAYMNSNYFPTVVGLWNDGYSIPFTTDFTAYPMDTQNSWYNFGSSPLCFIYYKSTGKCAIFFNCSRLNRAINEHRENMTFIDGILDEVPSGTELTVAKAIADKLLKKVNKFHLASWKMSYMYKNTSGDGVPAKSANCLSFAIAFRTACRRVGINADYNDGTYRNAGHAWVKITLTSGSVYYYDLARAKGGANTLKMKKSYMLEHGYVFNKPVNFGIYVWWPTSFTYTY